MKISNNEKITIVFGFLVVIIYICKYFDLEQIIKSIIILNSGQEDFYNPFKPNKIFKYKEKIYLLDTRNILEKDINPKVFNNFKEYQEFILELEKEYKNELNSKIKLEEDIKELDLQPNLKFDKETSEEVEPYFQSKKCNNLSAELSYNSSEPFNKDIKLNEDKDDEFNLISENKCKEINDIMKNERELNVKCEELKRNEKKLPKECEKLDFYKYNEGLLKSIDFQINNKKSIDGYNKLCLLEDTFRENMLEFDF